MVCSTSNSWTGWGTRASPTRPTGARPSGASTRARRPSPTSSAHPGSTRSSRLRRGARPSRRRRPTSIRSCFRACSSSRSAPRVSDPRARARMNDWLALCRDAVADLRGVLADLPMRADREPVVGAGMGGDDTTAIDAAAERVIVERLRSSGESFVLISEELGREVVGENPELWVVLDPIDGSLNAKRGLPFFAVSIAFAHGPTMGDVDVGYVYDFGSLALSLCHLAAGRVDAVCSLKEARSVDIAAAQLLVREAGFAIDLFDDGGIDTAPLDVEGRSRVAAAGTRELCEQLAAALAE